MASKAGHEQAARNVEGPGELDVLLGLDVEDPAAALALANAEAGVDLLAALRGARQRSAISEADLAQHLGTDARKVLDEVGPFGADPHPSSVRRYAGAIGARLELAVVQPAGDLSG